MLKASLNGTVVQGAVIFFIKHFPFTVTSNGVICVVKYTYFLVQNQIPEMLWRNCIEIHSSFGKD